VSNSKERTGRTAKDDLRMSLMALKEIGECRPSSVNAATARNVLHEDLGRFGDPNQHYSLDDDTRDRLIAHARQDASHAVLNSDKAMNLAAKSLRATRLLMLIVLACTAVILWAIWSGK